MALNAEFIVGRSTRYSREVREADTGYGSQSTVEEELLWGLVWVRLCYVG